MTSWTGTCGTKHEAAAQVVLRIIRCRKPHTLFILPSVERQLFMRRIERFTQAGNIAVSEYAKATTTNARLNTVNLDILVHQPFHDCLGDR